MRPGSHNEHLLPTKIAGLGGCVKVLAMGRVHTTVTGKHNIRKTLNLPVYPQKDSQPRARGRAAFFFILKRATANSVLSQFIDQVPACAKTATYYKPHREVNPSRSCSLKDSFPLEYIAHYCISCRNQMQTLSSTTEQISLQKKMHISWHFCFSLALRLLFHDGYCFVLFLCFKAAILLALLPLDVSQS